MHHVDTPLILRADAYTIGSAWFESPQALEFSTYQMSFRAHPRVAAPPEAGVYNVDDDRIVFAGLSRIMNRLCTFIDEVDIDLAEDFLQKMRVGTNGLQPYDFNIAMWRRVCDEFDGTLPIVIEAMPEGSVVYPHEPVVRVSSPVPGFGQMCRWFESSILHSWAATERVTAARHFLAFLETRIKLSQPSLPPVAVRAAARIMVHDFGARAAMCPQENEDIALAHLLVFAGTDTFEAAYQAYMNGAAPGTGASVPAHAHATVLGWPHEADAYRRMYENAPPGAILSMVGDTYDYKRTVINHLIPLAKRAASDGSGKVLVSRPDSGDAEDAVLWTLNAAVDAGLFTVKDNYRHMTTLRVIEGDSMTYPEMADICDVAIAKGFAPHGCFAFGFGGNARNLLARDHLSAKFALASVGKRDGPDERHVVKFSHSRGKRTLPRVKVLRTPEALASGVTIVMPTEPGGDALVVAFDGVTGDSPREETFDEILDRVSNQFDEMPPQAGDVSPQVEAVINALAKENGVP